MVLGFKEFFDAKKTQPTYFREKILAGVLKTWETGAKVIDGKDQVIKLGVIDQPSSLKPEPYTNITPKPKLHTFRVDQFDRWKACMSIQMVYRGPKYSIKDHFNKGIPELEKCKSTQKVGIFYTHNDPLCGNSVSVYIDRELFFVGNFSDDGSMYYGLDKGEEMLRMANNDGFDSNESFFKYFNKDWEGKCLHWTDLRY